MAEHVQEIDARWWAFRYALFIFFVCQIFFQSHWWDGVTKCHFTNVGMEIIFSFFFKKKKTLFVTRYVTVLKTKITRNISHDDMMPLVWGGGGDVGLEQVYDFLGSFKRPQIHENVTFILRPKVRSDRVGPKRCLIERGKLYRVMCN